MNVIDLINRYNLDKSLIANSLNITISTLISNYKHKDTMQLTINQLVSIHQATNIPYNDLLDSKVFSIQNIDNQVVTDIESVKTEIVKLLTTCIPAGYKIVKE